MKRVGEMMKEMGFNPESSEKTQKAFIKYLLRIANKGKPDQGAQPLDEILDQPEEWAELKTHRSAPPVVLIDKQINQKPVDPHKHEQLCFDFVKESANSEAC